MREILERIVEAEAEARRIVERAAVAAQRLVAQADQEAGQTLSRARAVAREQALTLVHAAVAEAERERARRLDEIDAELHIQLRLSAEQRREAVAAVVRCVQSLSAGPEPGRAEGEA